ncbi:MAG: SET domain-containing protein-lysine N-methyltransferase [Patescibacteria group bacterium]
MRRLIVQVNKKVKMRKIKVGRVSYSGRLNQGTIAKSGIKRREIISELKGTLSKVRTIYSIQVSHKIHLEPIFPGKFLNHSCQPNSYLKMIKGKVFLIAKETIKNGAHITFDYATTEYDLVKTIKCQCGKKTCRRQVCGFKSMSEEWKTSQHNYLIDYLKRISKDNKY